MNAVEKHTKYPNLCHTSLVTDQVVEAVRYAERKVSAMRQCTVPFTELELYSWFLITDEGVADFSYSAFIKVGASQVLGIHGRSHGKVVQVNAQELGDVIDPVQAVIRYQNDWRKK